MNTEERKKRMRVSIVEFLIDNPGANRPAIIDGVVGFSEVNKQMVTALLGELRDLGSIRKEGDRRSTKWFVVSPEEPKEYRQIQEGLRVSTITGDSLPRVEPRTFEHNYNNTMKRLKNALLGIDAHVALLEEMLAEERSQPKVNQEYANLRSAVYNFLGGLTTVADLRKALGDDE